jgi:hypothetical protein
VIKWRFLQQQRGIEVSYGPRRGVRGLMPSNRRVFEKDPNLPLLSLRNHEQRQRGELDSDRKQNQGEA